jgi:hypothetical protein
LNVEFIESKKLKKQILSLPVSQWEFLFIEIGNSTKNIDLSAIVSSRHVFDNKLGTYKLCYDPKDVRFCMDKGCTALQVQVLP